MYNMQNSNLIQTIDTTDLQQAQNYQNVWLSNEDPELLNYIYINWILIPTKVKRNILYSNKEKHFSQIGQSRIVDKVNKDRLLASTN